MSLGLILWVVTIVVLVLLYPATKKRYIKNVAKAKPVPPILTYGTAVLALPIAVGLYYLISTFIGIAYLVKDDSLLGLYFFAGFGVFFMCIWFLIFNIIGKFYLKNNPKSDSS